MEQRPSDPTKISFAPECFEQTGTRTEYIVGRSALHSGPAVFSDENEAVAFARKTGREVSRREVPILRRVRWQ